MNIEELKWQLHEIIQNEEGKKQKEEKNREKHHTASSHEP